MCNFVHACMHSSICFQKVCVCNPTHETNPNQYPCNSPGLVSVSDEKQIFFKKNGCFSGAKKFGEGACPPNSASWCSSQGFGTNPFQSGGKKRRRRKRNAVAINSGKVTGE